MICKAGSCGDTPNVAPKSVGTIAYFQKTEEHVPLNLVEVEGSFSDGNQGCFRLWDEWYDIEHTLIEAPVYWRYRDV